MNSKKYVLSLLVEDKATVLTRVAGLFARRNFNIHYLTVGNTNKLGVSRIILITDEYAASIEQIVRQLMKLVNVIDVEILDQESAIKQEINSINEFLLN